MLAWLSRMARDLLDTAILCYGGADAPEIPARQFVAHGIIPALDCPALMVACTNLTAKAVGAGAKCAVVPEARFVIWVVRCYPTMDDNGKPPSPEIQSDASSLVLDDLATLWDGLTSAWAEGRLMQSFPEVTCEAVTWGVAQPTGPLGGVAGWQIPLTVSLSGLRSRP